MLGLLLLSSFEISSPIFLNFDEKLFYTMTILSCIKLIKQSFLIKVFFVVVLKILSKCSLFMFVSSVLLSVMLLSIQFSVLYKINKQYQIHLTQKEGKVCEANSSIIFWVFFVAKPYKNKYQSVQLYLEGNMIVLVAIQDKDLGVFVSILYKEIRDQRKNPKQRVSSYFHSSFSPNSSPCRRL